MKRFVRVMEFAGFVMRETEGDTYLITFRLLLVMRRSLRLEDRHGRVLNERRLIDRLYGGRRRRRRIRPDANNITNDIGNVANNVTRNVHILKVRRIELSFLWKFFSAYAGICGIALWRRWRGWLLLRFIIHRSRTATPAAPVRTAATEAFPFLVHLRMCRQHLASFTLLCKKKKKNENKKKQRIIIVVKIILVRFFDERCRIFFFFSTDKTEPVFPCRSVAFFKYFPLQIIAYFFPFKKCPTNCINYAEVNGLPLTF